MKYKSRLFLFIIYFLSIFFNDYNNFSYWNGLILPILILILITKFIKHSPFNFFILFLTITFIQLLIYSGIYINNEFILKRTLTFGLIIINVFLLFNYMKDKNIYTILNPFIISALIFSLIVIVKSDFNYNIIDESELIGKNLFATILFSALSAVLMSKYYLNKYIWLFLIFWFLIILIFTGSLKFIIISIIICSYYYYQYIKFKLKHLILPIILLIYFWNSLIFLVENSVIVQITFARLLSLFSLSEYSSLDLVNPNNVRTDLILSGLDLFYNNPLFGIGLEGTRYIMGTYTHNTYLEMLIGGGIFIFSTFIVAMIIPVFQINKKRNFFLLIIYLGILIIGYAQRIYDNQVLFILITFLMIVNEKQKRITYY